jgi:hypothetical protein
MDYNDWMGASKTPNFTSSKSPKTHSGLPYGGSARGINLPDGTKVSQFSRRCLVFFLCFVERNWEMGFSQKNGRDGADDLDHKNILK